MTGPAHAEPADPLGAPRRLHGLLEERFWDGAGLVGPDPGIRLNYRFLRFVKSYTRGLPWRDELYYLQAQGYWTLANWLLADLAADDAARGVAEACAAGMVARQRPDGAWDYPNPEWRGRLANAEGTWASLGLIESYRRTRDDALLESALRWHDFLERAIGYQPAGDGLAVNYFAGETGAAVPNNSVFVLRLMAELAHATGDERFLRRAQDLLAFVAGAQLPTGELPYTVSSAAGSARLVHFQCFQYVAYECMDLARYGELTGDASAGPVLDGMLGFLADGVAADGGVPYSCEAGFPRVTYHVAAVAAALAGGAASRPALTAPAERARAHVLALQRPDGGFPHSRRDYGFLSDRRLYPRYLTMILHHLLLVGVQGSSPETR